MNDLRFVYDNRDDRSVSEKQLNEVHNDCVIRALSIYSDLGYMGVKFTINQNMSSREEFFLDYKGINSDVVKNILKKFGLRRVSISTPLEMSFNEVHEKYKNCVVICGNYTHVCCLKDGALRDIYDARQLVIDEVWKHELE